MGSRARTWRVDFHHELEAQARQAERVAKRRVLLRPLKVDGRYYVAADADLLLSRLSDEDRARPGHPNG